MADMAPVTAPVMPVLETRPRHLPEARFRLAEQVRNIWNVVPEEGTPMSALLSPDFWTHNARRLRPTDIIEAMPDDSSWYARFIVRSVTTLGATVALLDHYDFSAVGDDTPRDSRFDARWKGPHHKWSVVPVAGGEPVKTGFDSREAALRWLGDNSRELKAA